MPPLYLSHVYVIASFPHRVSFRKKKSKKILTEDLSGTDTKPAEEMSPKAEPVQEPEPKAAAMPTPTPQDPEVSHIPNTRNGWLPW